MKVYMRIEKKMELNIFSIQLYSVITNDRHSKIVLKVQKVL